MDWKTDDIPALDGRVALVTGANSGLGFEEALLLASRGMHVLLAVRNRQKGAAAIDRLRTVVPDPRVELVTLDLADLDSVRSLSIDLCNRLNRLDVLINNAGVMAVPERRETRQGFELQFGVNHLGHFALTGGLLPLLLATKASRVVTMSSFMQRFAGSNINALPNAQRYVPYMVYSSSKLANAIFTVELDRRLRASAAHTLSVGAHPGYSATGLQTNGPSLPGGGRLMRIAGQGYARITPFIAQSARKGALPALRAAVDPHVRGGEYYGPHLEVWGKPVRRRFAKCAYRRDLGAALWQASVDMTHVQYEQLSAPMA